MLGVNSVQNQNFVKVAEITKLLFVHMLSALEGRLAESGYLVGAGSDFISWAGPILSLGLDLVLSLGLDPVLSLGARSGFISWG